MIKNRENMVFKQVQEERHQGHNTRKKLYIKLEKQLKLPIISFYTSFIYPVMIEDSDADMLEHVLQHCELKNGFILMISSLGGSALAAERIINICRNYSGTGKFQVLIPGKAKSAATMICLGASKLIMGKTSELGAIDPQLTIAEDKTTKRYSLYNIVKSYEELFKKAVKTTGNLHPFLQQLENYDERDIEEYRRILALSEDIAITALKDGMLSSYSKKEIKKNIKIFLTPERVKIHGRAIYFRDVQKSLGENNVVIIDTKDPLWYEIYTLHYRLFNYVSNDNISKCIECKDFSFQARWK